MQFNYQKIKVNSLDDAYQKVATGAYNLSDFLFPKMLLAKFFSFLNTKRDSIEKNYCLAFCYEHGEITGTIPNIGKAVKLYEFCCDKNHAISAFHLGYIYNYEKMLKDPNKGLQYWKKCVSLGYQLPNLYIAKKHLDEQNYTDILQLLMPLADLGCGDAQTFLGDVYYNGIGVEKNLQNAFKVYRDAAIAGDARGQYMVGTFFESGIVCKQDVNMAFKYYSLSAQQGNADGQFKTGYFYDRGIGTVKSDFDAFKWYTAALKVDNPKAMLYMGKFYTEGRYVKKDLKKGLQMIYTSATKYKDTEAQCYLGQCFKQGISVGIDPQEAAQWFGVAAQNGNPEAQYFLASAYECGDGVEMNFNRALNWYKTSAMAGYPNSEYKLGMIYLEGKGVMPDRNVAAQFLEAAKKHGNEMAKTAIDKFKLK